MAVNHNGINIVRDGTAGWQEPPVSPVPPPADQTALRELIAAAARTVRLRLGPNAVAMAQRGEPIILNLNESDDLADAVLAVLPEQTDRAAVIAEAADIAERVAIKRHEQHEIEREQGALDVMTELRRVAAEEQPAFEATADIRTAPKADAKAEPHSCRNCEGVDPNTCLMNPDRTRPAVGEQPETQEADRG